MSNNQRKEDQQDEFPLKNTGNLFTKTVVKGLAARSSKKKKRSERDKL